MRQASLLGKVDARDPTRLPRLDGVGDGDDERAHAAGFDRLGTLREVSAPT